MKEYKVGQKVKGASLVVRTITKIAKGKIHYTTKKGSGSCKTLSFHRWVTGR